MRRRSCANTGRRCPIMVTFDLFGPKPSSASTFSAAASPARTSATRAECSDLKATEADCGGSSTESLANWDRSSSSWRTSQLCLTGEWQKFSDRLPIAGSMRNGRLFPRALWARHTCDSECSLWPTPTASMDGRGFGIPLHERSGRYKLETVRRVHALVGEHGWRIHPHFTEALMGYPMDHTAIEESATPSCPISRKSSGGQS